MQFKFILILTILGLFTLNSESLFSQVKTVNENGEKIIVYSDGSWEYDTEQAENNETKSNPNRISNAQQSKKDAQLLAIQARRDEAEAIKAERNANLNLERYQREINLQDSKLLTKTQKETQSFKIKQLKSNIKIAEKNRKNASKNARAYEKIVNMPIEKRAKAIAKLQGQEMPEEAIVVINTPKIKKAKKPKTDRTVVTTTKTKPTKVEKAKKPKKDKTTLATTQTEKTPKVKKPKKQKIADAATVDVSNNLPNDFENTESATFEPILINNPEGIDRLEERSKELSKYRVPQAAQYNNKGKKDCDFAFSGEDDFTGTHRRELSSRLLFTFTNEQLAPYMDGKDYVTCEGKISQISGSRLILMLTFRVQTMDATREFGRLDKGSPLGIKLINGKMINLKNSKDDIGNVNRSKGYTQYNTYYSISPQHAKELASSEVDQIRVVWSTGYEVYDIYELDFFKDQLTCFE